MSIFTILLVSFLLVGENLIEKNRNNEVEKKKIEIVANKSIDTNLVKEEVSPEPVKEEVSPEPVKEEVSPEPVKEVLKELDNAEDSGTNYLRLVFYIIGVILVSLMGMYYFLRKGNSTLPGIKPDNMEEPQSVEEVQADKTEEPQSVEEVQAETTEPKQIDEDENNNK